MQQKQFVQNAEGKEKAPGLGQGNDFIILRCASVCVRRLKLTIIFNCQPAMELGGNGSMSSNKEAGEDSGNF